MAVIFLLANGEYEYRHKARAANNIYFDDGKARDLKKTVPAESWLTGWSRIHFPGIPQGNSLESGDMGEQAYVLWLNIHKVYAAMRSI